MNNITEDLDLIGAQLLDPKSGISKIGNIYIRGGKIHHKQPNQIHVSKIFHHQLTARLCVILAP